jgi:uncharacterized protein (TIGR02646 family)
MRPIKRRDLDAKTQKDLRKRRRDLIDKIARNPALDSSGVWKNARDRKSIRTALQALKSMAGERERCMYCEDSHGTDIEHFRPKTPYPEHMFDWSNLLLTCTECNRFKGDRFPLSNGVPLLIDPTAEDPWAHLDFNPETGNLTARYEKAQNGFSPKGEATVATLHLDRREALGAAYQKTFRRLKTLVMRAFNGETPFDTLPDLLRDADDHALLGWVLTETGRKTKPFDRLATEKPDIWRALSQP